MKPKERIINTKPFFIWEILESLLPPEIFFSLYPVFWTLGIKVTDITKDYRYVRVEMPLFFYNKNYVGSHFGGALFALTDPFLMYMFLKILGRDYIVWDKKACIEFARATTENVYAEFKITDNDIHEIMDGLAKKRSIEKVFSIEIKGKFTNTLIAKVEKTLYFRKSKL
ncbi:MAG: DUF4442 domain-containing protein [Leptospiraceae bacterium]|nr:DUF4442 domain-containing protein [Leptospiraceae bacterium]MDW7976195.1 DUF4442 domain-containing protein [Leptospiraceae bacterium]